jgi:sugar lactone lactonase YvrE
MSGRGSRERRRGKEILMPDQTHPTESAARPQVLLTGLGFGESPRWHDNRLWFANWGKQEVCTVDAEGRRDVVFHMPAFPVSIDWLPDWLPGGRLLATSGADGRLQRLEPDGTLTTHADLSHLSKGWNEIVIDGRGNTYVNGAGFDLLGGEKPALGIIALLTPDGQTRQVADGLAFPNGMAVTPDNSTLIIAESYGKRLTAFDIAKDGTLSNRRVWADLGEGVPDGICIDTTGAVWYADVPNKRCTRVREGGEVLDRVDVDRGCFACMLGGSQRRTLFIMASEWHGFAKMMDGLGTGQVLTIQAPASGAGWP